MYHSFFGQKIYDHLRNFFFLVSHKNKYSNKKNQTPLHIAAEHNSVEIGEILISKGADINAIDIIYLNILILFLIKLI